MKIQVGKWTITNESRCFILNQTKIMGPESKTPGLEYLEPVSYYTNFQQLLRALPNRELYKSDATSLAEVAEEIRAFKKLIDEHLSTGVEYA